MISDDVRGCEVSRAGYKVKVSQNNGSREPTQYFLVEWSTDQTEQWLTKSQFLGLAGKNMFNEQLRSMNDDEMQTEIGLEVCRGDGLHPDTDETLSEDDIYTMPWLSYDYKDPLEEADSEVFTRRPISKIPPSHVPERAANRFIAQTAASRRDRRMPGDHNAQQSSQVSRMTVIQIPVLTILTSSQHGANQPNSRPGFDKGTRLAVQQMIDMDEDRYRVNDVLVFDPRQATSAKRASLDLSIPLQELEHVVVTRVSDDGKGLPCASADMLPANPTSRSPIWNP